MWWLVAQSASRTLLGQGCRQTHPAPVLYVYDCHSDTSVTGFYRNRGVTLSQRSEDRDGRNVLFLLEPSHLSLHPILHPAAPRDLNGAGDWRMRTEEDSQGGVGSHYLSAEWGGGSAGLGYLLIHLNTQLQDSRTSLTHPHPLLVQVSDLNQNSGDQALEQPPSPLAEFTPPPALSTRAPLSAHLKGRHHSETGAHSMSCTLLSKPNWGLGVQVYGTFWGWWVVR